MPEYYDKDKMKVEYLCDECMGGRLKCTNFSHPTYPPIHFYKCPNCGEVMKSCVIYPHTKLT